MTSNAEQHTLVVKKVEKHLLMRGAIPKEKQKSKKGWTLDGEIINLEPPHNPRWFAFNKLRKLTKRGSIEIESFMRDFGITRNEIKDSGTARSAIWINGSVGEAKLIKIIDWMRDIS